MSSDIQLINLIEKVILRGKKIPKEVLSREEQHEYQNLVRQSKEARFDGKATKMSKNLQRKLIHLVNAFEPSKYKFTKRQRQIIRLWQEKSAAIILMGIGHRKSSMELFENVFRQSKKLELPISVMESSRELFQNKARFEGKTKQAHSYFEESLKALEITKYELKAEWYTSLITAEHEKKKEKNRDFLESARMYFEELNRTPQELRSTKFERYFTSFGYFYFQFTNQWKTLSIFLKKQVDKFQEAKLRYPTELRIFRNFYIQILLRTNKLNEIPFHVSEALKLIKSKNNEWYRMNEHLMVYNLKKRNNLACLELYQLMSNHAQFKLIRSDIKNKIELNRIYAMLLLALEAIPSERRIIMKKMKMGKFLNSIPDFTYDKKGMNIPVYIASIIHSILSGNESKMEIQFSYIEKYITRYLKTDPLYRSNTFMKMLLQVYRQNYHPMAIRRHTHKHLEKLKTVSYIDSTHPKEIEEIPYEIIWNIMIRYLDSRRKAKLRVL